MVSIGILEIKTKIDFFLPDSINNVNLEIEKKQKKEINP